MSATRNLLASAGALGLLLTAAQTRAELPAFLRTENSSVRDGNEALDKGDAKGALNDYNQAARKLPDAPGVQLDRGLALLKQADYAKAREALLAATTPSAPKDLRADAYENLALGYYREADGLAAQNKHDEAQKLFREALDAGKRSLRLRPGDPNAAWNLELAARRIREEEQKQKQEDEKHKQDQKDQKDKNQGDKQNQPQDQDQKNSDSQQQQDKDQSGDKSKPDQQQQQQGKDQDKQKPADQPKPEPQKKADDGKQEPGQDKAQPALPQEAEQALDALEGSEDNFERYRARQRAARERRAPEKDW